MKFSDQSEPSKLPRTFKDKPRPKPWPESPAANSPVSLGRVADGPPDMVGRSASSRPNQQSLWTFSSFSKFVRRTVCLIHADGPQFISSLYTETHREHVFTLKRSAVDRRTSGPSALTCLNTLALTHEQPTYVPYIQPPIS